MTGFKGTDNKTYIRRQWDMPIIQERLGIGASYFGLPGPRIEDLLDWQSYLGLRTAVERLRKTPRDKYLEDLRVHNQIIANIFAHGLSEHFELLRGYIEEIILAGVDQENVRPSLSRGEPAISSDFRYDLVNLDFVSGFGFEEHQQDRVDAKRVRAYKKLLERQRGKSFLLIITLSMRNTIGYELTGYLVGTRQSTEAHEIQQALSWYEACARGKQHYKLKAALPLFVRQEAQVNGFDCCVYPPLVYTGSGRVRMMHFVFWLSATTAITHAFSKQSIRDVVQLPLLEVRDCELQLPVQHPDFDFAGCPSRVGFLPPTILETVTTALLASQTSEML